MVFSAISMSVTYLGNLSLETGESTEFYGDVTVPASYSCLLRLEIKLDDSTGTNNYFMIDSPTLSSVGSNIAGMKVSELNQQWVFSDINTDVNQVRLFNCCHLIV